MYFGFIFTDLVCFPFHCDRLNFILSSNVAIISAANKAAFTAPASPIGIVAKGQPEGQQFQLSKLSNPFNFFVSIGTPITGIDARAAVIEGNDALPPAAAMQTV